MDKIIEKYQREEFKNRVFDGLSMRTLISDLIDYNLSCFSGLIKKYDKTNLFDMSGRMIRGIEEFINLSEELGSNKLMYLLQFPLSGPQQAKKFENFLLINFPDANLVGRLVNIYLQLSAYKDATKALGVDLGFNNVGEGIAYLQSRRIYLHTIQPMVLNSCEGNEKISSRDFLLVIFPLIEFHLFTIGNLTFHLEFSYCLEDYEIQVNGTFPNLSISSNYTQNSLESFFLYPTRHLPADHLPQIKNKLSELELRKLEKNKILSYSECLNQIDVLEKLFEEYNLKECDKFVLFSKLIKEFRQNVYHDYYIVIPKTELLKKLKMIFGKKNVNETYNKLLTPKRSFIRIINSKNPFIYFQKNLYSTIYRINIFFFNIVLDFLSKQKKFQIDSGFIFEKVIKEKLIENGYSMKSITRVKNENGTFSEFDVVTTKEGTIYNFQCKNNYLDTSHIKEDYELFGKENKHLIKICEKAYNKERAREGLLLKRLKLKKIKHYVVTRFPLITRKSYIITFQNFEERIKFI